MPQIVFTLLKNILGAFSEIWGNSGINKSTATCHLEKIVDEKMYHPCDNILLLFSK